MVAVASRGISYPVTRPFLIKRFTVFVAIEFAVAIVLFSLINYTSTGFVMVSEYSTNPNATESQKVIHGVPDLLTAKSKPTCQPIDMDIGTNFQTSNLALTYTLNAVVPVNGSGNGTFIYHNNRLEDCYIDTIQLNIESLDRTAAQIGWINYGVDLLASVRCNVVQSSGNTSIGFTAAYNHIPPTVRIYDGLSALAVSNATTEGSLVWAKNTVDMYWVDLALSWSQNQNDNRVQGDNVSSKGVVYFQMGEVQDGITSFNFLSGMSRLLVISNDQVTEPGPGGVMSVTTLMEDPATYGVFWPSADALAKSFHSMIMTDLGQVGYTPNIFANEELLTWFSSNFSRISQDALSYNPLLLDNLYNKTYDVTTSPTGPLEIHPSVISAGYLCQVPRRKSLGDLFVSLLIADLVFLQALWKITMFLASKFVQHKDSKANWCQGCLALADEHELKTFAPTPIHSGVSADQRGGKEPVHSSATQVHETEHLISHREGRSSSTAGLHSSPP